MTQNNLNLCFNNFIIDELLIKIINLMNIFDIKGININYFSLILNCNSCYFRESLLNFLSKEEKNVFEGKFNNKMIDSSISITPRSFRDR
jgi:hypothetical protein